MTIAWSMDKLGPMARTADDCGLILSVIAGHDAKDHDSLPPGLAEFPYSVHSRKLRIGKLTNVWNRVDPALESAIDASLKALEKNGATIADVQAPEGPFEDAAELTILMEAASAFQNMIADGSCAGLKDPLGQINGYPSQEFTSTDYLHVQRVRTILQQRIDKLFDQFDVIAAAGNSSVARPLTPPSRPSDRPTPARDTTSPDNSQRAPDGISSLCGLPACGVPCGFSKDNLPFGIQFMARALNDEAAIAAARTFQSLTDWHKKRPAVS